LTGTDAREIIVVHPTSAYFFFKHVRQMFKRVGRGNQFPDPLSLWERVRVREALKGRNSYISVKE